MSDRQAKRIAAQDKLKWIVVGDGPALRSGDDMRAIIEWIDRAVDATFIAPEGFEATMLQAMCDGMFTVGSVRDGELGFTLTAYGRAHTDSMPHDVNRLTKDGVKGA